MANSEVEEQEVDEIRAHSTGSANQETPISCVAILAAKARAQLTLSHSAVFFIAIVALATLKAALMRYYALGGWHLFSAAVLEGAFILLVLGLVDIIPPRRSVWADLAVYTVLSVLMLVLTVYVSFYSQLFNPSMVSMAGQLGSVSDVVRELMRPAYALFLIDVPFLVIWAVYLQRAGRAERAAARAESETSNTAASLAYAGGSRRGARRSRTVAVVVVLAAALFALQLMGVMRLPSWVDGVAIARARGLGVAQSAVFVPHDDYDGPTDSALASEVDAPSAGAAAVSLPASAPVTPGGKVEQRVERIRGAEQGSRVATFSAGTFRRKNVIIIQVEALNDFLINKSYEGQEITPNINKLVSESWYWPNTYSQTSIGNTADAEFIVNTSLYAPRGQASTVAYANRIIPGLPHILGGLGYYSFTMHQNKVEYWNRKQMYEGIGFNRYYDWSFFHGADQMGELGSSDEELFKRASKLVRAREASGTPFYAQFITLSAHQPFEFTPESRRPVKTPEDLAGSLMGKYISASSYSDLAVGKFIDNLKASKAWDNSIVVIYGDHTGMLYNKLSGANEAGAEKLLGRPYGPADRQRIPLIIHLPSQTAPVVRTDVAGQVDVMPTVADLVGADITQIPHMGRSLFVASNSLVPLNAYLPGGSFVNDSVLFMPGLGFDDGTEVTVKDDAPSAPTAREQQDFQRMLELTKISDEWIMSLPKMKNTEGMGWIPNKAARNAGAKYGTQDSGTDTD